MLHLSTGCRYFYYNGCVDMRKGAYSLSGLVRNEMKQDVLSGDVFIFISRRGNKIKLLQWDGDGFALYEKGLEQGTFERPAAANNGHFSMSAQQLQYILHGIVLKSIRYKKRYTISPKKPVNTAFYGLDGTIIAMIIASNSREHILIIRRSLKKKIRSLMRYNYRFNLFSCN